MMSDPAPTLDLDAIEARQRAYAAWIEAQAEATPSRLVLEDVPALVARVRAWAAIEAKARVLINDESPWIYIAAYGTYRCMVCEMYQPDGHAADCAWDALAAALYAAENETD